MEFFLFQAHESFMRGFEEKPRQCAFCGQRGPAFSLDDAAPAAGETLPGPEGAYGCESCLKAGKFGFEHDTDAGFVSATGHTPLPPPEHPVYAIGPDGQVVGIAPHQTWTPAPEAITTLFRTPRFFGLQQDLWLSHCKTFMAYTGEWEPKDFNEAAPEGDGRALFLQMVDPDSAFLWRNGAKKPRWRGAVHVFECVLCGAHRAYFDPE